MISSAVRTPKILFVNPRFPRSLWGFQGIHEIVGVKCGQAPLGLATVAGLTPREFPVELQDENVETINFDTDADIVAIGVDGHGPTLVAIDARGEATRPAITFLDSRASAEAAELESATGVKGWSLGGLPAALWVERNEPGVAAATRWYLSTWEWLAYRLTGEAAAPFQPRTVNRGRHTTAPAPSSDRLMARATGIIRSTLPCQPEVGTVLSEVPPWVTMTRPVISAAGRRPCALSRVSPAIGPPVAPQRQSRRRQATTRSHPARPTAGVAGRASAGAAGAVFPTSDAARRRSAKERGGKAAPPKRPGSERPGQH
jgi:hypothetical protein